MKDERIIKQLNQAKGIVLYYVFISAIILVFLKYLAFGFNLSYYYVEIFVLLVTGCTLLIKLLIYTESDERIEADFEKSINIFFSILLYGGFFIHFLSASKLSVESQFSMNFTSTFILIGIIVFIVQLKKRSIYANYQWIECDKKTYRSKTLKSLLFFGLLFSINIIPYIINGTNILIGLLTIFISFVSLGFGYLFFAFYEKNHFDESILLEENKQTYLTKNASFLFMIPLAYSLISISVDMYLNHIIVTTSSLRTHVDLVVLQKIVSLYILDIALIIALMYFVIYYYVKKLNGPKLLLRLIKTLAISGFIISLIRFAFYLASPIIIASFNDINKTMVFLEFNSYLNNGFILYLGVILLLIYKQLRRLSIPYLHYFLLYMILPFIAIALCRFAMINNSSFLLLLSAIISYCTLVCLFIFFKKLERKNYN